METSEYSDSILYNDYPTETEEGTPVDWKLDKEDEKQVEANIEGLQTIKRYLERKLKDVNQKDSTTTKK